MTTLIITAQTAAATSTQFAVTKKVMGRTVIASGLTGAEVVVIQIKDGAGAWITTNTTNNLTVTDPVRSISSEGEYRLSKGVTAGSVSCSLTGA